MQDHTFYVNYKNITMFVTLVQENHPPTHSPQPLVNSLSVCIHFAHTMLQDYERIKDII